jgi:predicted transcriptional regulator of viral defense system
LVLLDEQRGMLLIVRNSRRLPWSWRIAIDVLSMHCNIDSHTKSRHLLKSAEILYKVIRMNVTHSELILALARTNGLLRTRDVDHAGVSRAILAGLTQDGRLVKISRGLYSLPERVGSEHDSVVGVAARSKTSVLCLISALRFHELTTQQSSEIWLAIPHKAHAPRIDYPPLRIVRMSGEAITQGIDEIDVAGTTIRVFCISKTVADCFKFRNKIGIDVALEALREAWQERRVNMDDLRRYAEVCRVTNVMRPYIESLTSG